MIATDLAAVPGAFPAAPVAHEPGCSQEMAVAVQTIFFTLGLGARAAAGHPDHDRPVGLQIEQMLRDAAVELAALADFPPGLWRRSVHHHANG
jgi:hypothetical protein